MAANPPSATRLVIVIAMYHDRGGVFSLHVRTVSSSPPSETSPSTSGAMRRAAGSVASVIDALHGGAHRIFQFGHVGDGGTRAQLAEHLEAPIAPRELRHPA